MSRQKTSLPHSWSIENWPDEVHPNTPTRARYLVRAHKDELIAAGALARVGRELIIIGDRYGKWLEKQAANVPTYEIAANRKRSEHKDKTSHNIIAPNRNTTQQAA